jgi:hypothetical protein
VLLSQESHAIQYLPRSITGGFEAALEVGVFRFESFDSLRRHAGRTGRSFQRLHTRFCLKGSTTECRKLVTQMTDELL